MKLFLSMVAFSWLILFGVGGAKDVSVADFGAKPNDGVNDAESMRKAVDLVRKSPGATLLIPPGVYDFRDEQAAKLQDDWMTGKMKGEPEKTLFRPYEPHVKGLDFSGSRRVTVKATGATLLCDGWMEPVSLIDCQQFTLEGLTIDYKRKPFSEGVIKAVRGGEVDLEFDERFPMFQGMPLCRMMVWDTTKNRVTGDVSYHLNGTVTGPGKMTIKGGALGGKPGDLALIVHGFHARPAVFIHQAKDIVLKNVTIHAQEGMGIVGERVHNLLAKHLRVIPAPGFHQATNTDATHYTSCTGVIRYEDCEFQGQGDDAINVHNYYQKVTRQLGGNRYEVKSPLWYSHGGVLDYYDVGDTVELVDKETLQVVRKYKVTAMSPFPKEWRQELTLDAALPEKMDGYFLVDATRFPRVEMVRCVMKSHLARSILLKNRHSLIEDCVFDQCTGTAVHVGAESDWHESGPCEELTIRRCRFIRNGRGVGTVDGACAIAVQLKAPRRGVPGIHGKVLIENNAIEGENAQRGIYVTGATEALIRGNSISGCAEPVKVEATTKVSIDGK